MSEFYTEADYENSVIELFRNMGYSYLYGPDIERDFRDPLYEEELVASLYRLNRSLPEDAISDALFKLKNFENGELVQKNAVFMDYLQNGIPVRYFEKGEERSSIVYLVDYKNPDNNSFIVANQWTFIENSNKRPDILLFLNGIPVVIVELKSPSREETDASAAYRQLRNYMKEIPSMFIYNAICVMSDQMTSKAGTITSGEDRFMEWKTVDGSYENTQYAQFDTFFEGMFQKERLLDLIKNFICFSNEGVNSFKILAGYHQYFAVRKAIESTKRATVTDGKGGVFWHTQGSGKSLSMVFYAHLLQEALDMQKSIDKIYYAAIYLRLSKEDGDLSSGEKKESNSIANQRKLIEDYLSRSPEITLVQEFCDDGYTGANFDRPDFQRMMEQVKTGKINCIIVKDYCAIIGLNQKDLENQGILA